MIEKRLTGWLLVGGIVFFATGMLLAELLYPGYNRSENYISDLGVGVTSIIFNTTTIISGFTMLIVAFLAYTKFRHKLLGILLGVTAAGIIGVGVFPENIEPLHTIFSSIVFFVGPLAAIASYKTNKSPISIVLGIICLLAAALFTFEITFGLGIGTMERLVVYPFMLWCFSYGMWIVQHTGAASGRRIPTKRAV